MSSTSIALTIVGYISNKCWSVQVSNTCRVCASLLRFRACFKWIFKCFKTLFDALRNCFQINDVKVTLGKRWGDLESSCLWLSQGKHLQEGLCPTGPLLARRNIFNILYIFMFLLLVLIFKTLTFRCFYNVCFICIFFY